MLRTSMTKVELKDRLLNDLKKLKLKVDFTLIIKGYSSSFFGRYNPNNNRLFLYVYPYPQQDFMYPYEEIFKTLLHEVCHCIQHSDKDFVRVKGVMHNKDFYLLYNSLVEKSYKLKILRGYDCDEERTV